jgi:hypothetical protein
MNIFVNQFLINYCNFTNETYHYDNYDTNEKVQLQNIIVSVTPWSHSVSLNEHSLFYSWICFNFISIFKNKFCYYENEFFKILVDKKFGKFNVTYRKIKKNPQILFGKYMSINEFSVFFLSFLSFRNSF